MRPYQKAEELLGKITRTEEQPDCYIFYNDEMKQDGVIVVMKKTGRVMGMSEYVMRKRS